MSYDRDSFLAGIAVGRNLRGFPVLSHNQPPYTLYQSGVWYPGQGFANSYPDAEMLYTGYTCRRNASRVGDFYYFFILRSSGWRCVYIKAGTPPQAGSSVSDKLSEAPSWSATSYYSNTQISLYGWSTTSTGYAYLVTGNLGTTDRHRPIGVVGFAGTGTEINNFINTFDMSRFRIMEGFQE